MNLSHSHTKSILQPLFGLMIGMTAFAVIGPRAFADDDVLVLGQHIDQHIARRWQEEHVTPAPLAGDAEFLRRVYIDVTGKIPSVTEVREFLADASPDKRRAVVDRLLESPGYITNFTNIWRDVLMPEANSDYQVRYLLPSFEAWLRERLRANTSYAEIVRELLTQPLDNRGQQDRYLTTLQQPSPLAFYQAKQIAPENLAAATSRMFLGIRIECAQCHDHPWDPWKRDEFWSFAAFYASIERQNPEQGIFGRVTELFDRREIAVPDTSRVVQAAYLDGREPQWRFRVGARQTLADWVTSRDNKYFARTAANRMWGHFFGIGLVDPVDDFGATNRPSHPELLDELAQAFVAHDFDLKFLIRAITASQTYQLTSEKTHASQSDPRRFARMAVKGMTPEQLYASVAQAIGVHEPFNPQRAYSFGDSDARSEFEELFANRSDTATETHATILQVLAMMNGPLVAGATDLQRSNTLAAVVDYPRLDTAGRIETLYLATLSRPPRDEESKRLTVYVDSGGPAENPNKALADVFWSLLNSSEFLFNH